MSGGQVVEEGLGGRPTARGDEVLRVEGLRKHFKLPGRRRTLRAVDGIDLSLTAGETLGLVGESGSGKTTAGRTIMRLYDATAGRILFKGQDIVGLSPGEMFAVRRQMQMVFQDPFSSLNPRMSVRDIVAEPLQVHGVYKTSGGKERINELLELVGLSAHHADRYPHEFSGGQRQRIGIARALALHPQVLILDEPVSALDVSIQAQIVNLLEELQDEFHLAYLFIAHDLSVVRHICDRVAVMYLGKIVESGPKHEVYEQAAHPYTQALLSAVPTPDSAERSSRDRIVLEGDMPSPANPPSGCRFRTRCWKATDRCAEEVPGLEPRPESAHPVACHYAEARNMLT